MVVLREPIHLKVIHDTLRENGENHGPDRPNARASDGVDPDGCGSPTVTLGARSRSYYGSAQYSRFGVPPALRLIVAGTHGKGLQPPFPLPSGNMADGGDNNTAIWPPDVQCFAVTNYDTGFDPASFKSNNCTVSQNMVNYLNLTREIEKYVSAYCANPPRDDDCPFDFCPNPEIAGVKIIIQSPPIPLIDRISSIQARWCGLQVSVTLHIHIFDALISSGC